MALALLVAEVAAQLGFQAAFQPGADDLLNESVLSVELDLSAVDESHEFVEGPGFLDGVHGAEGCDFLGDVGDVFHALFGLVFLDGYIVFFPSPGIS